MSESTAITKRTDREEFLAANPDVRKIQYAYVPRINALHKSILSKTAKAAELEIASLNLMRAAGNEIIGLEAAAKFPGGQITLDFARQLAMDTRKPLTVDHKFLALYRKVAANLTEDVETIEQAQKFKQAMLLLWDITPERGPQYHVPPPDLWRKVKAWVEEDDIETMLAEVKNDPNRFRDGHIRDDFKASLAVLWKPKLISKMAALRYIGSELGLEKELGL